VISSGKSSLLYFFYIQLVHCGMTVALGVLTVLALLT